MADLGWMQGCWQCFLLQLTQVPLHFCLTRIRGEHPRDDRRLGTIEVGLTAEPITNHAVWIPLLLKDLGYARDDGWILNGAPKVRHL